MRRLSSSPLPVRHDGWTVCRQLDFLEALARTGSVTCAARASGMSRQSAHRLRKRDPHGLFAAAWDRAITPASHRPDRAEIDERHTKAIERASRAEGRAARPDPPGASIS
jgi:hypothetical protein